MRGIWLLAIMAASIAICRAQGPEVPPPPPEGKLSVRELLGPAIGPDDLNKYDGKHVHPPKGKDPIETSDEDDLNDKYPNGVGAPPLEDDRLGEPIGPEDLARYDGTRNEAPLEVQEAMRRAGYEEELEMAKYYEEDRNQAIPNSMRWTGGKVPYTISAQFNSQARSVIAAAMNQYHTKTCIKWVPRGNEVDYIHFQPGQGCSSWVGNVSWREKQEINLHPQGCIYVGTIVHEMMHASGFHHEQTRSDRDQYVTIMWDNIQERAKHNFKKSTDTRFQLFCPYDYASVMHYGDGGFSVNGQKTIITKNPAYQNIIGNRSGFTAIDVKKLNTLYECPGKEKCTNTNPTNPTTTTTTTTTKSPCKGILRYLGDGECDVNNNNAECQYDKGDCCPPHTKESWNKYCGDNCKCLDPTATTTTTTTTTKAPCKDNKAACYWWKTKGYCTGRYAPYLKLHCQKTCGHCH